MKKDKYKPKMVHLLTERGKGINCVKSVELRKPNIFFKFSFDYFAGNPKSWV